MEERNEIEQVYWSHTIKTRCYKRDVW
jgi:hypothetical protein